MKDLLALLELLSTTIAKHPRMDSARIAVTDSLLIKQQLLIINCSCNVLPIPWHWIVSCSATGHCFSTHAAFSGLL
jgi:hypothetical protein